jgi:hypothetical protein
MAMVELPKSFAVFCVKSKGTLLNYVKRVTNVILKHDKDCICWPGAAERVQIADRVKSTFHIPNCIGFVDGTLLPFKNKPILSGHEYFCRKGNYSIHALIFCDDRSDIL